MAKKTTRKKPKDFFLQTYSGHTFEPKIGKVSQVDVRDIAHALSNLCRYSGQCRGFYSVAEHSVLVSKIIRIMWPDDVESRWAGLLHDATEAYVGDLTTPLKTILPKFIEVEDALAMDIAKVLKVKWTKQTHTRVKIADMIALSTEARKLFADVSHWDSIKLYDPRSDLLHLQFPLAPLSAKAYFTREFKKVKRELRNVKRKRVRSV